MVLTVTHSNRGNTIRLDENRDANRGTDGRLFNRQAEAIHTLNTGLPIADVKNGARGSAQRSTPP